MATEGFQRLVDASEEEQRELHMLRAGGMLPPGVTVAPSPTAGRASSASSVSSAGNWRLPASPPFLAGLVTRLRRLQPFTENSNGASVDGRCRRNTGARGSAHSGEAVSRDSRRATGSEGREGGGVTIAIEADLDLAPRPQDEQSEQDVRVLEAGHAARGEIDEAECTRDAEIGGGDATASRFEVYHNSCRYFGR